MNHPELVQKYPTHLDLRDGVVRVGSLCLNHPELVQTLCWGVSCRFAEVRGASTTPELVPYTPCYLCAGVVR